MPEDPLDRSGRKIALRVAMIPATKQPPAGALFYLEGGPGGAATDSAVKVNEIFAQVGRDRDLVMVDERGTGGSNRIACPHTRVPADDAALVTAYLRRCFARLGGDPQLYTTRRRRGRPRGGATRARLPQDRPVRRLVRRDARAGLPPPVPGFGAQRGSRRRVAAEREPLRAVGAERAARARHGARPLRGDAHLPPRLPARAARARRVARPPAAARDDRPGHGRAAPRRRRIDRGRLAAGAGGRRVDPLHDPRRRAGRLRTARADLRRRSRRRPRPTRAARGLLGDPVLRAVGWVRPRPDRARRGRGAFSSTHHSRAPGSS